MEHNNYQHIPVLRDEVLEYLNLRDGAVYFDGTAGRGGHIDAILSLADAKGISIQLLAVDKDTLNTSYLEQKYRNRNDVIVINSDYRFIKDILRFHNIDYCDGLILDLGFSSIHVDDPLRGFSFSKNGPLDMRYSVDQDLTAEFVVNEYREEELSRIIRDYGEESFHKRIARAIVRFREGSRIKTSFELRDIVHNAIPSRFKLRRSIDPATKTFQAIRIEVNSELESLEAFLSDVASLTKSGARLCIISFHSLEDRIVKKKINSMVNPCSCPPGLLDCLCFKKAIFKWLSKSVIIPSEEEMNTNPRSRSAKLRVAQRL